jgi:creatinine amidohydrolase
MTIACGACKRAAGDLNMTDQRPGYSVFDDTMADMTFLELMEAARAGAAVLWGLAVMEQHGPHLPLGTDVYVPHAIFKRAKALLAARGIPSVIAPPCYWGVNHVTSKFPGSFEVRPEIFVELMVDMFKSLKKDGFNSVFCLSGHGDAAHNRALFEGVKKGSAAAPIDGYMLIAPGFLQRLGFDPADPRLARMRAVDQFPGKYMDVHAGDWETSLILGAFPELVKADVARSLKPTDFGPDDLAEWRKGREYALRKTPAGYLGDPAAATAEKGRLLVEAEAAAVADAVAARLGR